jgi:glycosyltransferase involved in cell wall biosynthesis
VKTRRASLSVVQVNYAFDKHLADPARLLDRYFTLTGWSEAIANAGAGRADVVQRFSRDASLTRHGIDYHFVAGGAGRIARAVSRLAPDVVHVNGLIFPLATWRLRRALGAAAAIVVQNHSDGGGVGRSPWLRGVGRATRHVVDGYLFAALEHAAPWREAGIVGPGQPLFQVMEASTDFRPLPRLAARADTAVAGSPAVLWVGRLNANKDPLTVLAGFERFADRFAAATLTMIYSTDEQLAAVRERVGRSPVLTTRVRLVGSVPRSRMPAFFSAADLFVVGSHHEGSGYSLMEACACGAVPVVTAIPTFRLLAAGGGALWRPGDAGGLARALADVASRDLDAERARLAAHFSTALSWNVVGRRALEIYADVAREA